MSSLLLTPGKPMADLDLFRAFHTRVVQTTPYKGWLQTKSGARDAVKFETYAQQVLAGGIVARPAMETTFGNALCDVAEMGANG